MKDQIETLLRDYYDEKNLFLIGAIQEQKNPSSVNLVLVNPHLQNTRYKSKDSTYFISVDHLTDLNDIPSILEHNDDFI